MTPRSKRRKGNKRPEDMSCYLFKTVSWNLQKTSNVISWVRIESLVNNKLQGGFEKCRLLAGSLLKSGILLEKKRWRWGGRQPATCVVISLHRHLCRFVWFIPLRQIPRCSLLVQKVHTFLFWFSLPFCLSEKSCLFVPSSPASEVLFPHTCAVDDCHSSFASVVDTKGTHYCFYLHSPYC